MDLLKLDEEKLREACSYGDKDLIRFLINRGVDVNSQNIINGWSSLHWACKRGHTEIVQLLLSNGANLNIKNFQNETPAQLVSKEDIRVLLGCPPQNSYLPTVDLTRLSVCDSPEPTQTTSNEHSESSSCADQPPLTEQNPFFSSHEPPLFPNGMSNTSLFEIPRFSPDKESCCIQTSPHHFRRDAQTSTFQENANKELILKVRVSNINDPDFIEVDIPASELSFSSVVINCSRELDINPQLIERVRKLPNTRLRNDGDIQRLRNFDELEFVVRGLSSSYRASSSTSVPSPPPPPLQNGTKNNFQSITNFKNQTILY